MGSHEDRIARHRAKFEAVEAELAQERAEHEGPVSGDGSAAGDRRRPSRLRDTAFLAGIVVLSLLLVGVSTTLIGMAGRDFRDAQRTGSATVESCDRRGPVTNRGLGYRERCTVTIGWDDGTATRLTDDGTFTSSDIGSPVRVGYLGTHRYTLELAREDTPHRPWFTWIGGLVGLIAVVPGIFSIMLLHAYVRSVFRIRRR
ncbi:hypothetical protein Aph02nite_01130 [Actinoplanes philippinensis]|uniref:Uncharacterized protein n=1 Tax=Actinoplanes philippinensis TaxID=35752 RepID=A0A1I2HPH4_9ACTN|nr:DUF6346 domain-containing protein [Actinoplanes philippinensis]GIE74163.1 hypothetical protein Aph02nite_01130 [Actinoplanes philippinensis]SFF31200.1 hypothetical protein SAMN05421541_108374 [Actinoplanes philippinensis]